MMIAGWMMIKTRQFNLYEKFPVIDVQLCMLRKFQTMRMKAAIMTEKVTKISHCCWGTTAYNDTLVQHGQGRGG